jgi:hypothetical protein
MRLLLRFGEPGLISRFQVGFVMAHDNPDEIITTLV